MAPVKRRNQHICIFQHFVDSVFDIYSIITDKRANVRRSDNIVFLYHPLYTTLYFSLFGPFTYAFPTAFFTAS